LTPLPVLIADMYTPGSTFRRMLQNLRHGVCALGCQLVSQERRRFSWGLFSMAVVLRILWTLLIDSSQPVIDADEYLQLGRTLAQEGVFAWSGVLTTFRPPGYPFFVSLFLRFGSASLLMLKMGQGILGAVVCVMVYRLSRDFGAREGVARAAGIAAAVFPSNLSVTSAVWSEGLCAFLITLAFFVGRREGVRRGFLSGVVLGAACYVRPTALLLLPCVHLRSLVCGHLKTYSSVVVAAALGLVVATMPWAVRNSRLAGEPVWLSTHFGMNLYVAHHEGAQVGYSDGPLLLQVEEQELSEPEQSRVLARAALEYMGHNPARTALMALRRLTELVIGERDTVYLSFLSERMQRFSTPQHLIGWFNNLFYLCLLFLFLMANRPAAIRLHPHILSGIAAFWVFALFHALLFVQHRYKYPVLPLMMAVSAVGLDFLLSRQRSVVRTVWGESDTAQTRAVGLGAHQCSCTPLTCLHSSTGQP